MKLSKNARLRLYELVGYSQGAPSRPKAAERELREAGLMDGNEETAEAHLVAETLLFAQ